MSDSTGKFTAGNGDITGPNGNIFEERGINLFDSEMGDAAQVLADFPGLNFVRLNIFSYQAPSAYASFIQTMTSHGIVVELEDHTSSNGSNSGGSQGTIFTGAQLTNELNWYASVAAAYASNPYVWFGTDNEPSEIDPSTGQTNASLLSKWQLETYDAIRNAGNAAPILLEMNGSTKNGQPQFGVGYNAADYAGMVNVAWDVHYYGWLTNYSTNQQTNNTFLDEAVAASQRIKGADGTVPVAIGEYGPSTNGVTDDRNGSEVLQAVQQAANNGVTSGAVAWGFLTGQTDNLTNSSGQLTSYGQQVAQWIASGATTPAPTPTSAPSANDTVIQAGSAAAITDTSGNTWTISNGVVEENGQPAGYSANVIEIAYVNGTVWQENSAGNWWDWTGTTWGGGNSGYTTSPLPATPAPTPTPTPSANDTVVRAGSTAAITDSSSNTWTISNGIVDENGQAAGYSANVIEIAYVNGTVWQENSAGHWWDWTGTTWGGGNAGYTTSPLPTTSASTPTPDPTSTPASPAAPTPTINITPGAVNTVSESGISASSTSGATMLFVSGSHDTINLTGGTNSITDTDGANTYVLPAVSSGTASFTSDILDHSGDTFDLRTALAATNWNGLASTLANYLSVTDFPTTGGAVISIASTSGGAGTEIANIAGANSLDLNGLLAHSIT